jgi:hypothetical protein
MITSYRAVREAARQIAEAGDEAVTALREERVEHEPEMTDRMLGMIEHSMKEFRSQGIRWTAKTLTSRVRASQETIYGADFLGVLNIGLPDFTISKGFLAQGRLLRNGYVDDLRRLHRQCEQMLTFSSASFVFLYGEYEIRIVPAVSVLSTTLEPTELYSRSVQRFFEEHLQSFIGDRAINAPTPDVLERLRHEFEARSALLLKAEAMEFQQLLPTEIVE